MNDLDDRIGTEATGTDWVLLAYFVFAGAMLIAVGILFGAYVL